MGSKRKRKYNKTKLAKPTKKNKGPKLTSREALALETLQSVERKGLAEGHRDEPWMQAVAGTIATLKRL